MKIKDRELFLLCTLGNADDSPPSRGRLAQLYASFVNHFDMVRIDAQHGVWVLRDVGRVYMLYDYKRNTLILEKGKITKGDKWLLKICGGI